MVGSPLLFVVALMIIALSSNPANHHVISMAAAQDDGEFAAMFAFGDSLIDHGNNNYLQSLAKANYLPYGVDFNHGVPTGRFCNGRTIIDFLGDLLDLPLLPPYSSATTEGNILKGVNYASAAGGILEETGQNLGQRFSLSEQVADFENTLNQLKSRMREEELRNYVANSLVVMVIGSNDYINNYLQPSFYATSYLYTPTHYADLLINTYKTHILALHSFGLRKFVLAGIGPLGCIPNQLATVIGPSSGKCVSFANDIVEMFNNRLRSLVDQLNRDNYGSIFVYGNTFGAFMDLITNSSAYGLAVTDRGCCGIGRNQGQITCLPFSVPCNNRNEYVFWDAFHPTQIANKILATQAYSGPPSVSYPINVQQMAQLL